jgi:hypothetical protein
MTTLEELSALEAEIMADQNISPANLRRLVRSSQRLMDGQLAVIVSQIQRQSVATFGGAPWSAASWPEFAERLITHGKALIELSEKLAKETPKSDGLLSGFKQVARAYARR